MKLGKLGQIKSKRDEQMEVAAEAQRLKTILIEAIPVGSDYAAVLLALTDVQREFVRLWVDSSPPKSK